MTETLLSWGTTPVAVTRFCEHPELPAVGGTKDPDVDAIVALAPDIVVMCDEENRIEDAAALGRAGIPIHVTSVRSVADVAPHLSALAEAVGAAPTSVSLISAREPRLRAFVPIWKRPWMTLNGDTYGSSVLAHLGVVNVFASDAARYPETDLDEARRRRPGVVLAPSEPYPFKERHRAELEAAAPVVFVDGQDLFWWGARTPGALDRLATHLTRMLEG